MYSHVTPEPSFDPPQTPSRRTYCFGLLAAILIVCGLAIIIHRPSSPIISHAHLQSMHSSAFTGGCPYSYCNDKAATDPLRKLNAHFRSIYATQLSNSVDFNKFHLFIVNGSSLIFMHKEHRHRSRKVTSSVAWIPPIFSTLKSIAHIPVSLWILLSSNESTYSSTFLLALSDIQTQVAQLSPTVIDAYFHDQGALGFDVGEAKLSALEIVELSGNLLDRLMQPVSLLAGPADVFILEQFANATSPHIQTLISSASKASLSCLHNAFTKMIEDHALGASLDTIIGVVTGEDMPRSHNSFLAYLVAALDSTGEGDRVFYATHRYSESEILESVGTHLLDNRMSTSFFGKADGMQSDILGAASAKVLASWKVQGKVPLRLA